jgi:hypothetical protein
VTYFLHNFQNALNGSFVLRSRNEEKSVRYIWLLVPKVDESQKPGNGVSHECQLKFLLVAPFSRSIEHRSGSITINLSIMRTSLNFFIGLVLFTTLNVLLLSLHRNAVPKRDIFMCALGLVGLLIATRFKHERVVLDRTKRYRILFTVLSSLEVIFTILLPWWLIYRDFLNGYLMAPHLFVFQAQIALESIIFMAGYNPHQLMFGYTVIANIYRALALTTWVSRTLADDMYNVRDHRLLITLLPGIAVCLWIFSNLFIWFEWYPLLRSEGTMAETISSKKE